jgi:hypothetical protein
VFPIAQIEFQLSGRREIVGEQQWPVAFQTASRRIDLAAYSESLA